MGVNEKARRVNGSNPSQCTWGKEGHGITLTQVTGKGRCVGQVPPDKMHLCANQTNIGSTKKPAEWLLPAKDARWVCSKIGVTPCLSLDLFNGSVEFCVQVIIIPKILYHPENFMYDNQINQEHYLTKREPNFHTDSGYPNGFGGCRGRHRSCFTNQTRKRVHLSKSSCG